MISGWMNSWKKEKEKERQCSQCNMHRNFLNRVSYSRGKLTCVQLPQF